MSRRESRVSMGARQNDALVEFENFKKKFLLANKHITKLNSTLSMKIEELNTEISTLYAENLRLRASEITLTTELKREREKSRKILFDAQTAAHTLSSQLAAMRDIYNIPLTASPTPTPPRRKTPSPRNSTYLNNPTVNRLSREPQVPNINEDEEPEDVHGSPPRKSKKKPRLSASRLPLPARSSTPPTEIPALAFSQPQLAMDFSSLILPTKKRRQSGLLLDLAVIDLDGLELDDGGLGGGSENDLERENEKVREKERKRVMRDASAKPKAKLKDVTNANSPRTRPKPDPDILSLEPLPPPPARAFLAPAPPSPPPPEPQLLPVVIESQPVSSGSSSSLDREVPVMETDTEAGGRERRTRKSVNYAEPKLNTKMRKPIGSEPATTTKRSRSSTSSVPVSTRRPSPPLAGHGPKTDPLPQAVAEEEDDLDDFDGENSDAWADGEYVPPGWSSTHVNLEGRRRAVQTAGKRKEAGDSGRRHSSAM
ncbi:hypothetical protein MIND_00010500 [Mycena indigotica]|uniref:Shugoshin C-terminal domain-containing protein n=1 Tax=Mycena indigotica TaxID=2126181 RepID=A0A8H6WJW2_9AGAR|nr:uncharacterized protein MIND_00010500 [Mycena indigotica]KAF7314964.1 hypothetical protein MIND_00010500 [Mycena indigotica]